MGENGGKLPLACLIDCLIFDIGLSAEGWELGNSPEEVVVSVDIISLREGIGPLILWEDVLDALNVGLIPVVLFD